MREVAYGNCVSCGFPILVSDSQAIRCPNCSVKNQAITQGGTMLSYQEALVAEAALLPGPYEVQIDMGGVLSATEINEIQDKLSNAGVQLTGISQSNGILSIKAIKQAAVDGIGFWPVLIVGVLGLVTVGYFLFQAPTIIDSITKMIIPIGLFILGIVIVTRVKKS